MIDLRNFSKDQLRKIARVVERKTDLFIDATKKFMPLYGDRISVEVVKSASDLMSESLQAAKREGLSEIKGYTFSKEYIRNHKV
jgi:hypothetical protein